MERLRRLAASNQRSSGFVVVLASKKSREALTLDAHLEKLRELRDKAD